MAELYLDVEDFGWSRVHVTTSPIQELPGKPGCDQQGGHNHTWGCRGPGQTVNKGRREGGKYQECDIGLSQGRNGIILFYFRGIAVADNE